MSARTSRSELIVAIEAADRAAQELGHAYHRVEVAHAAILREASHVDQKGYFAHVANALPLVQLQQEFASRLAGLGLGAIVGNPSIARRVSAPTADTGAGFVDRWRALLWHLITDTPAA